MQPLLTTESQEQLNFRCIEDNIGFVMLSEIHRAYSHQLVELLKKDEPDLTTIRRLALTMQLASDHLSADAALVCHAHGSPKNHDKAQNSSAESNEPASVQAIIDLSAVASQKRLAEMNLRLHSPEATCDELFVSGNPWELSYVVFFLVIQCAQTRRTAIAPVGNNAKINLVIASEADFVDLIIGSDAPISPYFEPESDEDSAGRLSREEWFCLQRLANRNNAHIHVQRSTHQNIGAYSIVLRLPTFHPGHEEPLDFLTLNAFPMLRGGQP